MENFPSMVLGLGVALGIGLLIGIEREKRKEKEDRAGGRHGAAGVRTFALAAMFIPLPSL